MASNRMYGLKRCMALKRCRPSNKMYGLKKRCMASNKMYAWRRPILVWDCHQASVLPLQLSDRSYRLGMTIYLFIEKRSSLGQGHLNTLKILGYLLSVLISAASLPFSGGPVLNGGFCECGCEVYVGTVRLDVYVAKREGRMSAVKITQALVNESTDKQEQKLHSSIKICLPLT